MTSLFKKLNFKGQEKVLVVNPPASFEAELADMSKFTEIERDPAKISKIDFVLIFVLTREEIDKAIDLISPKLQGDPILWFCYPKGTSKKYKCDFNRDTGWETLGKYELEVVRQVAIDEDWSALRFRKTDAIKTLTRRAGFAISKTGKERTMKDKG
jgi:hypothetical protein